MYGSNRKNSLALYIRLEFSNVLVDSQLSREPRATPNQIFEGYFNVDFIKY